MGCVRSTSSARPAPKRRRCLDRCGTRPDRDIWGACSCIEAGFVFDQIVHAREIAEGPFHVGDRCQGHASYPLPRRSWLAVDATWFAGGEPRVDGVLNPDLQRNARVGATLSIPIVGQQSIKLAYSTGTTTRRGSDFSTFNATWRLVMF